MRVTLTSFGTSSFRFSRPQLTSNFYLILFSLFTCSNYLGNKAWTLGLEWNGKAEFNAAEEHEWQGAGLSRSAKGLTFLQVYDAGHMVRQNRSRSARAALLEFYSSYTCLLSTPGAR